MVKLSLPVQVTCCPHKVKPPTPRHGRNLRSTHSSRGQLEITDVNTEYLRRGQLKLVKLARGVVWLETGTSDSLLETAQYVTTIGYRQGVKVGCIEEVAYRMGYIGATQVKRLAGKYAGDYRSHRETVANESPNKVVG